MKKESIEGIGSIHGGEYDTLTIEGVGKLKSEASANRVSIEGMFKSKGKLTADEISVQGFARFFRNIKAKRLLIEGMLKVRHANVYADHIICNGLMTCSGEVSADQIDIDGVCSVANMYGDNISIHYSGGDIHFKGSSLSKNLIFLSKLYLGRKLSLDYNLVDQVECTQLSASGLKSKIVRAGSVQLEDNCIIEKLYCDGEMKIDPSCIIGKIFTKDGRIIHHMTDREKNLGGKVRLEDNDKKEEETNLSIKNKRGKSSMSNGTIKNILDLYKDGKINAKEAEQMLLSTKLMEQGTQETMNFDTPWPEDGKLRIVAFIGKKLLKKGDEQSRSIEVRYDGPALNVECYGNLSCNNIGGNANAGGSLHCEDVGGNASCGGSMTCKDIGSNVSCGGSLNCKEVHGGINAGGGVHIMK
jgi:cytoskeletal protein CcmA (bactofilin family)